MAEILYWTCLALVAHTYVLYPAAMLLLARRMVPRNADPGASGPLSHIAVVIAAHNEEQHIGDRIRDVLANGYPLELLTIHVGSDGSTDRTVELARAQASDRLRIHAFEVRRGKASVLNDILRLVAEDIVVFTDANTAFEPGALAALVAPFADPKIGAVNGELRLHKPRAGDNADSAYWRVETQLRIGESSFSGLLGANGGIYAIRKAAFRPLPADTIVDDFTVAMNAAASGWKTVFEPHAIAHEETPPGIDDEFRRRVRIGTGNYQAFFRYGEYWSRSDARRRFTYLSHKVLRWFTPHLLLLALLANVALVQMPLYRALLLATVAGLALALFGFVMRGRARMPAPVRMLTLFVALNAAFLLGFWRYLAGSSNGQWQRTKRA
jgi:cellulose synthase/poly-beta-1,6-N-acetylglucosamine synthase-like glycosyltransferase